MTIGLFQLLVLLFLQAAYYLCFDCFTLSEISFLKLHIYTSFFCFTLSDISCLKTCQLLILLLSHPYRLPLLLSPLHIFSSHKPSPCLRHHTDVNNQLQQVKQICVTWEMHNRGISCEQTATGIMQIMDHRSMSQIICCDHNFFG